MSEVQDITSPMSSREKRATLSLASIYGLRMFGLFLIMPVLSLFAEQLSDSTPALIGWTIGIYGLTQSLFQIPFGLLSDRVGRKKIIVIGLTFFAIGSVVAALSQSIYGVLLGRAIQGSGAVAGPTMALLADLTQEVHRTKAMALIGASIGLSFGLAMVSGPVIASFTGVNGLFWLIAALSVAAIFIIIFVVPQPGRAKRHYEAEVMTSQFSFVLKNTALLRLDYGIFVLHLILSASFVVVPLLLRDAGLPAISHWQVYLPVFAVSMLIMVPFVILAEKKRKMKSVFVGAIAILALANLGLLFKHDQLWAIAALLGLFFCGFNLLEATLPSLVSKTAPGDLRGTAMGVYSTTQFLGAGLGGALGGWCYGRYGVDGVFLLCALMALSWALWALSMTPPRYWSNLLISLADLSQEQADALASEMLKISGVEEITPHFEDAVAYLKVDNQLLDKPALQAVLARYGQ